MPASAASAVPVLRLHPSDNVLLARERLAAGLACGDACLAREAIPAGHKVAARDIAAGEAIVKGGHAIGRARATIAAGSHVHVQNVEADASLAGAMPFERGQVASAIEPATFQGIVRADGRVATRNYIAVIVTVNCAATVARKIAEHFTPERLAAWPNVDGVVALTHELGCGMEMTGEPMDLLRRTIAGTARHANVAGALLCSLGCERNNVYKLIDEQRLQRGPLLEAVVMQEKGGTQRSVDEGIRAVEAMLPLANRAARETVSARHLCVGVQTSGADGFTELTAGPALGVAVDLVAGNGGTAIFAGTSEMAPLGAWLAARARSPEVAARLERRLQWWREYNAGRVTPINGRLAPSNAAGGLTTPLERAIAAAKRWGRSPLEEVYEYAHPVTAKGLVFMDTPTHEAIAATGQIAGGANIVCMATGHGTGFGSLPAPTLKLASHSAMYRRMQDDLDIDCGPILDGTVDVEAMGQRVFQAILRHASGEKTQAEDLGAGESEFVPWPIGLTA